MKLLMMNGSSSSSAGGNSGNSGGVNGSGVTSKLAPPPPPPFEKLDPKTHLLTPEYLMRGASSSHQKNGNNNDRARN